MAWQRAKIGAASLQTPNEGRRRPFGHRAQATQHAAAPLAHPPSGVRSPGQRRAAPMLPGGGCDAGHLCRRFHCCHCGRSCRLVDLNAPGIHSAPTRNFSFSVLKLTDHYKTRELNQVPFPDCPRCGRRIIFVPDGKPPKSASFSYESKILPPMQDWF